MNLECIEVRPDTVWKCFHFIVFILENVKKKKRGKKKEPIKSFDNSWLIESKSNVRSIGIFLMLKIVLWTYSSKKGLYILASAFGFVQDDFKWYLLGLSLKCILLSYVFNCQCGWLWFIFSMSKRPKHSLI